MKGEAPGMSSGLKVFNSHLLQLQERISKILRFFKKLTAYDQGTWAE